MEIEGLDQGRAVRIKEAAKRLFVDRGYDGTTMQAIADASRVNKALLHYYFQSKDKLFLLIFREEQAELLRSMEALWREGEKPLRQRLEDWIDEQTVFLARAPRLHLFMINEMTRNPDLIEELITEFLPPPGMLLPPGPVGPAAEGEVVPPPKLPELVELACSVYSLVFFPAVASPMIHRLLGIDSRLKDELLAGQVRLAKEFVRQRLG